MEIVFSQIPHSFSAQSIAEDIMKAEPLDVSEKTSKIFL